MKTIHRHAFADLARYVAGLRPPRLVVIDGAGGSGKSVFAARLITAAREHAKTVIERTPEYDGLFDLSRLRCSGRRSCGGSARLWLGPLAGPAAS